MSVPFAHNTSYRTVSVSSDPSPTVLSPGKYMDGSYRTVSVGSAPISPVQSTGQYLEGSYRTVSLATAPMATNGYETLRYVPVQQSMQHLPVQQSYMLVNNAPQQMMQQSYMLVNSAPQVPQTMYYQTVMPRVSVSSLEDSEVVYRQQVIENVNGKAPSVFSQTSSPAKSPEPSIEEEEVEVEEEEEEEEEEEVEEVEEVEEEIIKVKERVVVRVIEKVHEVDRRSEVVELPPAIKMDTRYFGELLAEVYRKNCDIHTCISEHVAKIRGRKHLMDPSNDYKVEKEEVEALIPKGSSELTKQQIRYLLQTRLTADKSMRLLLTTFSSLREELIHMADDLKRLESDKESLERDLSFKTDQAQQYDSLLAAVRENNRQLQMSLKESSSSQRTLETQIMSSRTSDSGREYRIKELEGSKRAMEKENEMLRQKLAGQGSSTTLQVKTEELSRTYKDQLSSLRMEKDKELQSLRSQILKIQTEFTTERSGDKSLQLRISELLTTLEQRQTIITRQEEEIRRLQQDKTDSSKSVTKTIITKRYRNQYPLLGLLSDDYQSTSPVKEDKTIVIERSGQIIKQEIFTSS